MVEHVSSLEEDGDQEEGDRDADEHRGNVDAGTLWKIVSFAFKETYIVYLLKSLVEV